MTQDLVVRAQAGDNEAFAALIEPHRAELRVHCYRMLGSLQDADDALQEVLLAAWQGLGGFEQRASVRTWLYRIATNRCLNARRANSRRAAKEWDVPNVRPPEPTRLGEVVWLQPFPDALLEPAQPATSGRNRSRSRSSPHCNCCRRARSPCCCCATCSTSRANEVARMLDATAGLGQQRPQTRPRRAARPPRHREPAPAAGSPAEDAIVAKFVRAWESADSPRWPSCSPTTCSSRCRRSRSSTRAANPPSASASPSSARAAGSNSCRPGRTDSPRSVPMCAAPTA